MWRRGLTTVSYLHRNVGQEPRPSYVARYVPGEMALRGYSHHEEDADEYIQRLES